MNGLDPRFLKIMADAAARPDATPIGAVPVPRDLPALCLNPGCKNPPEAGSGWCSRACWWADEGSMNEGRRYS